jgi:HAL2 family 3'(2'),5'-bisphosphate nucleotidase
MPYEQELTVALAAVKKAAALCSQVQQKLVTSETIIKKDKSPVTVADLGSQAVICLELLKHFENDPIVAEEDVDTLRDNQTLSSRVHELVTTQTSGITHTQMLEAIACDRKDVAFTKRYWTIDPIDGTKGFLRKEQYAIALALIDHGQVVLGVLGCPNYAFDPVRSSGPGSIFYAVKGQGAFARSLDTGKQREITTDNISEGGRAKFCESVESAHASHEEHAQIATALNISTPPFRIDSQAKYAAVSRGDASIYLRLPRSSSYREKIWDHAAGACIVEQAGGRVSDFTGNPLDFTCGETLEKNTGILATNGIIHEQVLNAIRSQIQSSRT